MSTNNMFEQKEEFRNEPICIYPKHFDRYAQANSVNPDQTACEVVVLSGLTLFYTISHSIKPFLHLIN